MEITVFRRFWFTQLNVFSCKIFDFQSTTNWILCYFFNIASKKSVFWYVRVCQNTHCLHWWPYIWQQFNSTNDCYLKLSLEIAIYIKFWTLSVFSSAFLTLSPLPPPAPLPPSPPPMKSTLTWWGGLFNEEVLRSVSTRRARGSDATTFNNSKQIFSMPMPRTWFKVKEFRLE